jgi:hypothetical protein
MIPPDFSKQKAAEDNSFKQYRPKSIIPTARGSSSRKALTETTMDVAHEVNSTAKPTEDCGGIQLRETHNECWSFENPKNVGAFERITSKENKAAKVHESNSKQNLQQLNRKRYKQKKSKGKK